MAARLSTTAYAVLGMLALRPMTPYELTQQMRRSLDYCWTTSERSLYDQPERLTGLGLLSVEVEGEGAGSRRTYAITDAGRRALQAWLATPSAMPRFQNEPLLRVLLADQGSVDDLQRVLGELRRHLVERAREGVDQLTAYLSGEGLFQERAHIVVVTGDLIGRLLTTLDEWAADTAALTAGWETTTDVGLGEELRAKLEELVRGARRLADGGPADELETAVANS